MSTTAEIIAKLEAEAFDAEETARVWGFESDTAPPLRDAAARLDELERENARMRATLQDIDAATPTQSSVEASRAHITPAQAMCQQALSDIGDIARAALAGSGEP